MISALIQNTVTIICLAFFCYITTGLGQYLFVKTGTRFNSSQEILFFSFGIGSGVVSYTVFILSLLHLLYPAIIFASLGLLLALAILGWCYFKNLYRPISISLPKGIELLFFVALVIVMTFLFIMVLTPEIGKDALSYHLAVPKLYLKNNGFYFIEGNIFANYPLFGEMLYLLGLFLHNDILAKGMHFFFAIATLLGIYVFISSTLEEKGFSNLSALVFISIPSIFIVSHVANNDLIVTFYTFGAVLSFVNWSKADSKKWLIICGIFSGLAIACKYTSLLLPFMGVLGILWTARHQKLTTSKAFEYLSIYMLILITVGCPFYIKNFLETGNPFYPFLYTIFGGTGWDVQQARYYDFFLYNLGVGKEFLDYMILPWNLSINAQMDSSRFDGILGPIFLVMIPFALGMRNTKKEVKIIAIFCTMSFIFWALSVQQVRYLFHILPFMGVLVGVTLSYYLKANKNIFRLFLALIGGCLIFNFYHIVKDFIHVKPLAFFVGKEERGKFLGRNIPSYEIVEYVNGSLPLNSRIFLIYMRNFGYLYDRDYYSDSMFESYTIQKILSQSHNPEDVQRKLKEKRFTHILYDIRYVWGEYSSFSTEEKILFHKYEKECLLPVKTKGPYRLLSIR
jgi:hypothetical protein